VISVVFAQVAYCSVTGCAGETPQYSYFSQKFLSGSNGSAPIPVLAGQIVQVKVTYTFS
jgi:hypothetical protein